MGGGLGCLSLGPGCVNPSQPAPSWVLSSAGSPVLGSLVLYWWPDEGWKLGCVCRSLLKPHFSHAVGYWLAVVAFSGGVASLLDEDSYGSRWVSLVPVGGSGAPCAESLNRPSRTGPLGCVPIVSWRIEPLRGAIRIAEDFGDSESSAF